MSANLIGLLKHVSFIIMLQANLLDSLQQYYTKGKMNKT